MGEPVQHLHIKDEESGCEGEATCLEQQSQLMTESLNPGCVYGGGTS